MRVSSKHAILYVLSTFILTVGASSSTLIVDDTKTLRRGADIERHLKNNNKNKNKKKDIPVDATTCDAGATIIQVEHEDGHDESYMSCETTSGKSYRIEGVDKATMKSNWYDIINEKIDVDFPNGTMMDESIASIKLPPGQMMKFKKKFKKNKMKPWKNRRQLAITGTKTVLVVRVIASDSAPTASINRLSDSVFGNNADGDGSDLVNLRSQYKACSYDQLNFIEATPRTGISVNIVNGMYLLYMI